MKNKAAVALGRLGGLKRAAGMTRLERIEGARKAAVARWTAKRNGNKSK